MQHENAASLQNVHNLWQRDRYNQTCRRFFRSFHMLHGLFIEIPDKVLLKINARAKLTPINQYTDG